MIYDFAIIGAGFAGTMAAVNLSKKSQKNIRIALIDKRGFFGEGVAYGTKSPEHLLNVPTGKMSAFKNDAKHFQNWALENIPSLDEVTVSKTYLPRVEYGRYLNDILEGEQHQIECISGEATDIIKKPNGDIVCVLADEQKITAKKLIWALGNFPPQNPYLGEDCQELFQSDLYVPNPWGGKTFENLKPDDDILFVGTALTAVDMMVSLHDRGHKGKIYGLSRRGLMSRYHEPHEPSGDFIDEYKLHNATLLEVFKGFKKKLRSLDNPERDWRSIVDSVRPHTHPVWSNFSLKDKLRFLRHLRYMWDVHRHRIAPESAAKISKMIDNGQLAIDGGRCYQTSLTGGAVILKYKQHKTELEKHITVQRVVNCTGPSRHFEKSEFPLVQNMLKKNFASVDETGMGLKVDENGFVSEGIYTLGISRVGELWESKTVKDIRVQAEELATHLLENEQRI